MSTNYLFVKNGYIQAPLANGVGRFVLQCQRITFKFCKTLGSSRGLRDFIQNDLIDFARHNPGLVVYLKPRRHRSPVLVAEYLNGHREWMSVHNFPREEVYKWINNLRTSGGTGEMRYKNYMRTDHPSIQGVWTPFTNKAPEKNLMQFPNLELSQPSNMPPSASEILLEMYGKSAERQSN